MAKNDVEAIRRARDEAVEKVAELEVVKSEKAALNATAAKADKVEAAKAAAEARAELTIQSKGSTTSYGRRYLLCGYFGIATADDDGSRREASGPDTISAKDAAEVTALVEKTGTKLPDLLSFAKSETVEEIPAAKAGQVLQLLRSKAAKIAKEGSTDG